MEYFLEERSGITELLTSRKKGPDFFIKRIKEINTRFIVILLTILTAVALPANVFAQKDNIRFERLSVEDGLSQVSVHCILQDSQGFMWFGTEDGLNKYDGYNFEVYRHNPENRDSLGDSFVLSIFEDSGGTLWIGTIGGGLNKFDRKAEKFTRYQHQEDNPNSLSNNMVRSIFEDSAGTLWIGTLDGGLNKFDRRTKKITRYQHQEDNPHSLSHNDVFSIFEDSGGILWIGTIGGGLNKFDRKQEKFTRYQHQADNPHSLSNNMVFSIFEDSGGTLWIGTYGGGLNKFDRKEEIFTRYQHQADNPHSLSGNRVPSIFEDSNGILWIGTWGGGLNKFDRKLETFTRYQHQADNPHSLNNNFVFSIFEDSGGILWIGTKRSGLNKFDRRQEEFTRYQHQADNPHSLSNNVVQSIFEDSGGTLWIVTEGGLNKFDRESGTFTRYQHQADNPHSLSHNDVFSIFEDSGGILWIGTFGGGLNKFDRKQEKFTRYQHQAANPHSLSNNDVCSIFEDSGGTLWIGTYGGGLNKFDRKEEIFTRYQHQADNSQSLSHNYISSIFEDSVGTLWIGTQGGLNKFDRKQETFTRFQHLADNPHSLSHNVVNSIFEDSGGTLWIGTWGGLNKFDRKAERFTHFREKHGLPNDVVCCILEDDEGNLWLSTFKGISKFNPKTGTFTNYDEKDGLQSNEFTAGAYCKDKSGRMYFGGVNGFNEFYPANISGNTYIPPVVITDFLLFNKPVKVAKKTSKGDGVKRSTGFELEQHINFTREITLDYTDYIFALEFSALNYRQPEKNQFAYKLEGYDKDWVKTDYKHRRVTYTNLPHGEYVFRVKASNDDGYWNKQGTSLKIKILPPWWKTWWFQSLVLLVILAAIYGLYRLRIRNMKVQQINLEQKVLDRTGELNEAYKKLQELDRMKTDFLSLASHELRTPLTSVLGFARIIKKRLDQRILPLVPMEDDKTSKAVEQVSSNIDIILSEGLRLTALINDVLDITKMESGKMEWKKETVSIASVLESAGEATAGLFENKPLEMTVEIQDHLPDIQGDRERLIQVFINLISNAVKFTEQGKVTCRASCIGKEICISVSDTGIGIAPEDLPKLFEKFKQVSDTLKTNQKGTGLGLPICKQIVEYHGGEITIESKLGKGTVVTVKLPVEK